MEILNLFADWHGLSLARRFIADICGNEKWTRRGKSQLARAVLTFPDIWPKFIKNETTTGLICYIQTDLLRSWIAGLAAITASESNTKRIPGRLCGMFPVLHRRRTALIVGRLFGIELKVGIEEIDD